MKQEKVALQEKCVQNWTGVKVAVRHITHMVVSSSMPSNGAGAQLLPFCATTRPVAMNGLFKFRSMPA
jgi:hypothetical protein